MSFANDSIHLPVKPMNGHNETNNRIKSKFEQNKRKRNPSIISLIQVRTKIKEDHTCTFCKQKGHKLTNCDRRISIGNEFDPNYLFQFVGNSCPFKIAEQNKIGTIK